MAYITYLRGEILLLLRKVPVDEQVNYLDPQSSGQSCLS